MRFSIRKDRTTFIRSSLPNIHRSHGLSGTNYSGWPIRPTTQQLPKRTRVLWSLIWGLVISLSSSEVSSPSDDHRLMFKLGHFCRQPLHFKARALCTLSSACQLIDEMPDRKDSGLSALKMLKLAAFTRRKFVSIIVSCIVGNGILTGMQLHCLITKCGFVSNPFIGSSLVDRYLKCGLVKEARSLFDEIPSKDLVLWNVIISCYSLNGLGVEAFRMFQLMRVAGGFVGDGFTFSSLLSSCSSMSCCCSLGEQIHGLAVKLALDFDVVVGTAAIDMYMKCGHIEDARRVFEVTEHRNVVSWNAIIVGYGHHGNGKEAMKLLSQMIRGGSKPDELTLASVLSSCANSAMANEATQIHNRVVKTGFQSFLSTANALIMAYSKSGCISNASRCFSSISNPDLISWTTMITSYAYHGLAKEAIWMFERMVLQGVRPDGIAFVGILSACSHAGLVERGLHYFVSMRNEHQIEPSSEHYTCLVDLLGRYGHLDEAYNMIVNMPCEPDGDVLGAFIGACKVHGNTKLAKWAADRLFSMEHDESANYKLMSNIYAGLGCWDDVAKLRKMMRDGCRYRVPGCSWTECGGKVHTFVSGDESHPQAAELYSVLGLILGLMKDGELSGDCILPRDEMLLCS